MSLSPSIRKQYISVIAVDALCITVSVACLALRLYVRRFITGRLGYDDWLLLVGVNEAVSVFPYIIGEVFVRAAYAVFYLRIIPRQLGHKWQRYILIAAFALYATVQTSTAFVYLFQCGAPSNLTRAGATCIDNSTVGILFNNIYYLDAAFDWLLAFIAIRVVWTNTMNQRTRMTVVSVILFGCCAGMLAIAVIPMLHYASVFSSSGSENLALSIGVDMVINFESMLAIVCISLAVVKPLISKWLDNDGPRSGSRRWLVPEAKDSVPESTMMSIKCSGGKTPFYGRGSVGVIPKFEPISSLKFEPMSRISIIEC
ncbi:hypothetical protein ANO11243_080330 [Dothideomycetidae sp. 11243]|nr:hypothetical protein ANO11243_080330 [fungal sp. No.11243]